MKTKTFEITEKDEADGADLCEHIIAITNHSLTCDHCRLSDPAVVSGVLTAAARACVFIMTGGSEIRMDQSAIDTYALAFRIILARAAAESNEQMNVEAGAKAAELREAGWLH